MEFKRLSDVEVVAEPAESANVLIEENGVIKRAPKTAVGGGSGFDFVVIQHGYDYENAELVIGTYEDIRNKLMNKEFISGLFCRYSDEEQDFIIDIITGFRNIHLRDDYPQEGICFEHRDEHHGTVIFADDTVVIESYD